MRYRAPAVELEAIQWTGDNLAELQERFGADRVELLPDLSPDGAPDMLELSCGDGQACYVRPTEWITGVRGEDGAWELNRLTDVAFKAQGFKRAYRDRNDHYVPDGLNLNGKPQYAEVSEPRELDREWGMYMLEQARRLLAEVRHYGMDTPAQTRAQIDHWLGEHDPEKFMGWHGLPRPAKTAQLAMASPDEFNRNRRNWWWADVSGDGTHWSQFDGHQVQVDVELHTSNRREVNDWKGRDEIQPGGEWLIKLNRQPVYGGYIGRDVPATLRAIERKVSALLDNSFEGGCSGLDFQDSRPFAEQLTGRRIYYDRTPAVITSTVLDQGCIMIKPVGVSKFPRSAHDLDSEPDGTGHREQDLYDEYETRELKVHIDSPHVWWHRDRPYSPDEPDGRYGSKSERMPAPEGRQAPETQEPTEGSTDDPGPA